NSIIQLFFERSSIPSMMSKEDRVSGFDGLRVAELRAKVPSACHGGGCTSELRTLESVIDRGVIDVACAGVTDAGGADAKRDIHARDENGRSAERTLGYAVSADPPMSSPAGSSMLYRFREEVFADVRVHVCAHG